MGRRKKDLLILLRCRLSLTCWLSIVLMLLNALLLLLIFHDLDSRWCLAGFGSIGLLLCLRVTAFGVWVGRCDTVFFSVTMRVYKALVDLVAFAIDDTGSGLVTRLEADLSSKC